MVAADTGGTFTDVAVYDACERKVSYGKTLTNYTDLVEGALDGLASTGLKLDEALLFKHGTTHVINTFIQRSGARTALVATRGFRDTLEIGRGNRPVPFALEYRRDPPLVPRELRFEVGERMDAHGRVVEPLDMVGLAALAETFRREGIAAIAVSFINAYANPAHEEAAVALLRKLLPDAYVTSGTLLTREWFEFERTSTAAANAYVGARMGSYITGFDAKLRERGFTGSFYMMGSNGGVLSTARSLEQPVALVESGPIGGCIGAAAYARALNEPRLVAFDMGGTTAKCALVEDAGFEVVNTYYVNGYEQGFPIRTPVLDIVEVGAGGGSLAWIDAHGRMQLGPHSAGSEPGPIAFGRGGTEPTVTDANVVLGRVGSGSFMDGSLPLDVHAAAEGVSARLAAPLGFQGADGVDRVAQGILDLACVAMANAIKAITIERGRDVRDYTLFAFGGGGPIFATELARSLGIREVVIPPHPGMFSSFGMLLAPVRRDVDHTFMRALDEDAVSAAHASFAEMARAGLASLAGEVDTTGITFRNEADMSYAGQSHTVKVALPPTATLAAWREAFEQAYRARYGHLNEDASVRLAVLRVVCEVPLHPPRLEGLAPAATGPAPPPAWREVYFAAAGGRVRTAVHRRADLPAGTVIEGPAVIEEYSATTILGPGERLSVGALGELTIRDVGARSGGGR